MFYPTGDTTGGRTLISVKENSDSILPMEESENNFLAELDSWLEENNYCVEKSELKSFMEDCGFCTDDEIAEMEGGAPAPAAPPASGGGFADLGSTPGMGNVTSPGIDGSPGSGDKFDSLTAGTPAAKRRKSKRKKELSIINDFDTFMAAMKKNQPVKESNSNINEDENNLRRVAKTALENMYMFGGMPKPDPKYDEYMEKMIEAIVQAAK